MCYIDDEYVLTCQGEKVGFYYVYDNNTCSYTPYRSEEVINKFKSFLKEKGLLEEIEDAKSIPAIDEMMQESKRVKGKKRAIYVDGPFTLTRIPQETDKRFLVYDCRAEKGEKGYSEKKHDAPHYEGPKTPEGMREWTTWYAFEKMDDGTFVAALDESWWWGGGHNDGGTIRNEIPEEWFELPYDEFLENVVTLSAATHYGFTPEELKEKKGLKKFFGYK